MRIIAFAKTTPAVIAGRKTRTRRLWAPAHAARWEAGDEAQSWTNGPRVRGATRFGTIRLTAKPRYEPEGTPITAEDWELEGFAYLDETGQMTRELQALWNRWEGEGSDGRWVVDFEVIERAAVKEK